jgi:putative membrane protein
VKALAEKMVSDHTAMNAEFKTLAESKKVEISAVTDPNDTEVLKNLEEKATGPDFDKAFLNQLEKDHKKTISLAEEITKDSKDGDLKAWADKALPNLRAHLEHVKSLQDKK